MKISLIFTLALAVCFVVEAAQSASGSALTRGEWIWGTETNGFAAGIRVEVPDYLVRVVVRIAEEPQHQATNVLLVSTNQPFRHSHWAPGAMYFLATNLFCGPIELRDTSGQKVPLTMPEVSFLSAYPDLLSIDRVRFAGEARVVSEPPSIVALLPDKQLHPFLLRSYFRIDRPGNYRLKVWPKVYQRAARGADVCRRIDFPPVSVAIDVK